MSNNYILQETYGEILTEESNPLVQDLPYVIPENVSPITSQTKTIPSYLYWQYQTDQDLQAFVTAYNQETQSIIDWFNSINLPIYTGLNGALLDWVGQGVYGYQRPVIGSSQIVGLSGQIASFPTTDLAISSAKEKVTQTVLNVPDDIYQRMLTWFFFKGDGEVFSIPWLKRRLFRFLYGESGQNAIGPFTPYISVTFTESSTVLPTCNITITDAPAGIGNYLEEFINTGLAGLPFRFTYVATIS